MTIKCQNPKSRKYFFMVIRIKINVEFSPDDVLLKSVSDACRPIKNVT